MAPRTQIRGLDIRAYDPNNPGSQRNEEQYNAGRYFEADCLATLAVGHLVYVSADKVLGYYQVAKVDITNVVTMPAIGIVSEKTSATRCFVQATGLFVTTGLIPGIRYWIGSGGTLTSIMPVPSPGNSLVAQVAGHAISSTELLITLQEQATRLRR